MRSSMVLAGAILMVQGKVSRSVGWVDSAPNLVRCPVDSITQDQHTPSGLDMCIANKTSREYHYSEVALHYPDGTKSVVSATGRDPRCSRATSLCQHLSSSGSAAAHNYPYKATWTQLRYILPPNESSCVGDEDVVNEKVEVMLIRVLPSDTSTSTTLTPNNDGMTSSAQPVTLARPAEDPEIAEFLGEGEDGIPVRRRATFGELCQLLALFTILGLLHYVSMRWAARWHAPQADVERRVPQCE